MSAGTTAPVSAVEAILDRITVASDLSSASVDGRPVEVDHPFQLRSALAAMVYNVVHVGADADEEMPPFHSRDEAFEAELAQAVPHHSLERRFPVVSATEDAVVVVRDGVRVRVARDAVPDDPQPGVRVRVRVRPCREALSPGFFFVEGSQSVRHAGPMLRLYAHLRDVHDGLSLWRRVVPLLEELEPRYRTKIVSVPAFYPRRDALVVYLGGQAAEAVGDIVAGLHGAPELSEGTSAFTRAVAAGLATAWEPEDPRKEFQGLSFGQHRSYVLVDALLEAARSQIPLEEAVAHSCALGRVDPRDLSRNLFH